MKLPLEPLARPLGEGSVILYERITTWVTKPKYKDVEVEEPPVADAPKDQAKDTPKDGQKASKGDAKPKPKAPAAPEQVLDKRAPLKRLALLAGGGYLIVASDYTTVATEAGMVGWIIAAWMVGYRDRADDEPAEEEQAEVEEETPAALVNGPFILPSEVFARWLVETIRQRPGIHLYELYPAMRALPGMQKHDDTALRGALTELHVPVTRSLRVGPVEGRSGVRLADLAPLLPQDGDNPLSADGDAGQSADSPTGEPLESAGEHAGERVKTA